MENISKNKRIWELDFARGIAIVVMILLHIPYMIEMYAGNETSGIIALYDSMLKSGNSFEVILVSSIHYLRKYGGAFFIFVSGICATFGKEKRDFLLVPIALALTGITYLIYKSGIEGAEIRIQFGILSLLAFAKIAYRLFDRLPVWLISVVALAALIFGYYLMGNIRGPESFLVVFGLHPVSYPCFDYQPIFPQFGWFLFGAVIGKLFYKEKKTVMPKTNEENIFIKFFSWIGRHSLVIYLIQLPVIYLSIKLIY